jgi:hypothetical protein
VIIAVGVIVITVYFVYYSYFQEPKIFRSNFLWGKRHYDAVVFVPNDNWPVKFDGVTFTYDGNRTLTYNQCSSAGMNYDANYHANGIESFKVILKSGQIINSDLCWPPPRHGQPCYGGHGYGISCGMPSAYTVNWFDQNETVGIAYCIASWCSSPNLSPSLYVVEKPMSNTTEPSLQKIG